MSSKQKIHQLKITLSHVKPAVWRRIQVPEDVSLYRLAAILINAMGWHGGHLHQFYVGQRCYGVPNVEFGDDMEIIDERKVSLKDVLKQGIKQFTFEYDFGDGWKHVVEVEKTVEPESGVKYPICVDGKRKCPPEDCGGPHGYDEFLKAIRDLSHPEHESMIEWIDGDFDPEEFDLNDFSDLADSAKDMEELWDGHF